jgi:hypothetical protein
MNQPLGSRSSASSPVETTYFTTVLGNGQICPISERVGKRRVRSIAAGSAEGRKLLRAGLVTIQALDGRRYSGMPVVEIYDRMVLEVQEAAGDPALDPRAREDLDRLDETLRGRRADYS